MKFPWRRLSISKLRRVYRVNHIKLQILRFNQQLTETQIRAMNKDKLEVLPKVIRLIQNHAIIVFVDEAIFTSGQIRAQYWAKAVDASLKIDKAKIGLRAIAVVAAINLQGRVVALLLREGSICTGDFVDFLQNLKSRMRGEKTYVFLENLRIQHTFITASKA